MEILKTFPDKSVDLVFADLPYNAKNIGPNARVYDGGIMQVPVVDYRKFCTAWITESLRVGKCVVMTPGISNVCYYPQPDWICCWHKPAAVSFNRFGLGAWQE